MKIMRLVAAGALIALVPRAALADKCNDNCQTAHNRAWQQCTSYGGGSPACRDRVRQQLRSCQQNCLIREIRPDYRRLINP